MAEINIGLIGAGIVGGGFVKIFKKQAGFFTNKLGLPVKLRRIADINSAPYKNLPTGNATCSENADDVLADKEIDIVIELIGGTTNAKGIVLKALTAGKHVVTANKALIAEHGPEIFETAEKNGVSVFFEASVGGGMPTIKTIRESLIGNEIISVRTIINATCNYILSQMTYKGLSFDKALKDAQKNGFAEADPVLDIGGGDTGHKIVIMASLLYAGYVPFNKIYIEGINGITSEDINYAKDFGYCIKLLGIIKKGIEASPVIDVRVHPAMLQKNHILSSVSDVFNAILIEGDAVGPVLLYGKGAGEMPTASAVISDVIDLTRNILEGSPKRIQMDYYCSERELEIKAISSIVSRYYLRFSVADRPKVLASIDSILGEYGVSIASLVQKEARAKEFVPVVMLTHEAREENLQKAIIEIEKLDIIKQKTQIIRIED